MIITAVQFETKLFDFLLPV